MKSVPIVSSFNEHNTIPKVLRGMKTSTKHIFRKITPHTIKFAKNYLVVGEYFNKLLSGSPSEIVYRQFSSPITRVLQKLVHDAKKVVISHLPEVKTSQMQWAIPFPLSFIWKINFTCWRWALRFVASSVKDNCSPVESGATMVLVILKFHAAVYRLVKTTNRHCCEKNCWKSSPKCSKHSLKRLPGPLLLDIHNRRHQEDVVPKKNAVVLWKPFRFIPGKNKAGYIFVNKLHALLHILSVGAKSQYSQQDEHNGPTETSPCEDKKL